MRLRAHLRAFGAAVLDDVRASLAAPVVERLRADLAAERAKSEGLRAELTRANTRYAQEADKRVKLEEALHKLSAASAPPTT